MESVVGYDTVRLFFQICRSNTRRGVDCSPCGADDAGVVAASHRGLGLDGVAEVWAPGRRGGRGQSGQARPASLPSAAGGGGADVSVSCLPVPRGRHGDGHSLAGDDGGCSALARGAQGVAQPGRYRPRSRRGDKLA
jgi:hypothetical protein